MLNVHNLQAQAKIFSRQLLYTTGQIELKMSGNLTQGPQSQTWSEGHNQNFILIFPPKQLDVLSSNLKKIFLIIVTSFALHLTKILTVHGQQEQANSVMARWTELRKCSLWSLVLHLTKCFTIQGQSGTTKFCLDNSSENFRKYSFYF